jgi:hypothetical protein
MKFLRMRKLGVKKIKLQERSLINKNNNFKLS